MSIPGLTRDNVASHLQKHRMHRKRDKEAGAAASVCLSREPAVTASDTFGNTAVQRSSTVRPAVLNMLMCCGSCAQNHASTPVAVVRSLTRS